jgi:hypothetical protein
MRWSILPVLFCLPLLAQEAAPVDKDAQARAAADLRARIEASPKLPFHGVHFAAQPRGADWESGFVSWVAVDAHGIIYEIQRGERAQLCQGLSLSEGGLEGLPARARREASSQFLS